MASAEVQQKLDMSLDELVSQSTRGSRAGRRGNRGGRTGDSGIGGGVMRNSSRPSGALRNTPYGGGPRSSKFSASRPNSATRISVVNLPYDITEADLWTLFSREHHVRKVVINYDRDGQSTGTAQVTFNTNSDASNAIRKFHNITIDGRPMKLELLLSLDTYQRQYDNAQRAPRNPTIGSRGRGRGRGRGFRSGNREQPQSKSAEELDREMEAYMAQAQGGSVVNGL